MPEW